MLPEKAVEFQHIVPISTVTGEGIEELKSCVRKSLDQQDSKDNDAHHREQLLRLQVSSGAS